MSTAHVIPFRSEFESKFADIWVPWLRNMTGRDPEPEDTAAVSKPKQFYIDNGGAVFFAEHDGEIVGVVAVKKLSADNYEFCKLVVTESARGFGIGRRLVDACIEFSRSKGAKNILLQSFKRLEVALKMYRQMGFVETSAPPEMAVLSRTEVVMGLPLSNDSIRDLEGR
jgi:GNAT superfamily N-acetyltransferase